MKDKIETNIRKWISLIIAVLIYYVIHEGSHLLVALSYGVFKKIKLSTLGVQIVINDANLSNFNLAIFCVVGFLSTFITSPANDKANVKVVANMANINFFISLSVYKLCC